MLMKSKMNETTNLNNSVVKKKTKTKASFTGRFDKME